MIQAVAHPFAPSSGIPLAAYRGASLCQAACLLQSLDTRPEKMGATRDERVWSSSFDSRASLRDDSREGVDVRLHDSGKSMRLDPRACVFPHRGSRLRIASGL